VCYDYSIIGELKMMNIHFETMVVSEVLAAQMVKWYSDKEIAHYVHPNFVEKELKQFTVNDAYNVMNDHPDQSKYVIYDDLLPIGDLSITKNFHLLYDNSAGTAWVSISIGERDYWGKGIAKIAMEFLENECRNKGFKRIELGVFDHNVRAQHFYLKMGYHEIARYPHFTYSNGNWHADIRMEKIL